MSGNLSEGPRRDAAQGAATLSTGAVVLEGGIYVSRCTCAARVPLVRGAFVPACPT